MSSSHNRNSPYYTDRDGDNATSREEYPELDLTDISGTVSQLEAWAAAHEADNDIDSNLDSISQSEADIDAESSDNEIDDELNALTSAEISVSRNLTAPYPMDSPLGGILLKRIRQRLSLPESSTAEAVQNHLASNISILRHLQYGTVAHPGHRRAARRAKNLLFDIADVDWTEDLLREGLFILGAGDREAGVFVREELRKMYRGNASLHALLRRRAEDSEYARSVDEEKRETRRKRELRPNSLLRDVISAEEEE
ncbi:hypothetical protein K4F52_008953 [Lecanicillium sp. MT-2017a]|nr:hypothetical protein K4F52_008953 [Lecanicillium sp. MT-2017a]